MGILRTDKISGLETPTAVTGSVSFDGNDNLSIGSAGDFNFLHNARSDWTAEFWVKTGSATRQFVFGNGASSAQVGFSITVMSPDDNDGTTGVGKVYFYVNDPKVSLGLSNFFSCIKENTFSSKALHSQAF